MTTETPPPPLAVVRPDWVDNNGHMSMGFYLVVFDIATNQFGRNWGSARPSGPAALPSSPPRPG